MYVVFRQKGNPNLQATALREIFVCEFLDYYSMERFIEHCHEACIGTYECLFAFNEYTLVPTFGGTFSNNKHVHLGWKEWIAHGWHVNLLTSLHCQFESNLAQDMEKVVRHTSSLYRALNDAISLANAFGDGPMKIDNDIAVLRETLIRKFQDKYATV